MTTSRPFERIGPVTWLLLQGAATVASILLAFGIDAWWDHRKEAAEKNAMLESVRAELLSNLKWVEPECAYRQPSLKSVRELLKAVAVGRYEDTGTTLDRRLGDLTWANSLRFSTGAIDSLLSSGRAAAIEDTKLRALLAGFPRKVEVSARLGARDQATLVGVLTPFLSRNADLLKINNEAYLRGMPPDGAFADPAGVITLSRTSDHTPLLKNPEFAGVLVQKIWIDIDVRDHVCGDMTHEISEIARRIDRELHGTT